MPSWVTPITDRTYDDITARTQKAFFNIADWLRIYGNSEQVQIIVNVILYLDFQIAGLTPPVITDFPAVDEINTLIDNIDRLRIASGLNNQDTGLVDLKHDWQAGAGAFVPDFENVNDWEEDLRLIRKFVVNIGDDLIYCGVAGCGQDRVWQARWHRFVGYVPADPAYIRTPRSGPAGSGTGLTNQNGFRRY